ncbi:MJ1255/VC2487 family glycosyltransferase [Vibrio sp.]|uniref:MJ1255/VC2487 family glycosyltransferase n=1 Tax=Vibrio sp. TaxID=678 RepID=UPI003D0F9330
MNILYGVQGTGNGHIARARAMEQALANHSVAVDFLFSGRPSERYFSMEQFGAFQTRRGMTFQSHHGRVDYLKTLLNNSISQLCNEVKQLDLSGYDLVVTDFEPVTAWAAKRQGVPCISLSHQNAFRYQVPSKGASWLDRQVIQHFAPAQHYIGLHWYHFDQPILPPIVDIGTHAVNCEDFILVYLPFESREEINQLLARFTNQRFISYHPDNSEMAVLGNVEQHPLSREQFQCHLHRCQGVIANGGFELPSEALVLGKKLLLKPLSGQFEQQSNVATLETMGLASAMSFLDASTVREWLDEPKAEPVGYPDVASAISDWLIRGDWSQFSTLRDRLWEQAEFPSYTLSL